VHGTALLAGAGFENFPAVPSDSLGAFYAGYLFGGAVEKGNHPVQINRKDAVANAVENDAGMLGGGHIHSGLSSMSGGFRFRGTGRGRENILLNLFLSTSD
jgi:hypothetical protein